jgi:spermidine synthase
MEHWEQALRNKPDYAEAGNNLAWLLATLARTDGGDPVRAVTLAERACKLTNNRVAAYLDTLASAYAAAGRFEDAITTAGKAIDLARSTGQPQLVEEIQSRLQLYRNGQAHHQAVDVTSPSMP